MVKSLCFQCRGCRFDPGQGTKIPHVEECGQIERKKRKIKAGEESYGK